MRDYIGAMRAVWRCWQEQVPLEFQSEHYDLNLMVPLFDPGPIDHPDIPIHVAVIGPNMTAMAECADGIRLHPVVTSSTSMKKFCRISLAVRPERGAMSMRWRSASSR